MEAKAENNIIVDNIVLGCTGTSPQGTTWDAKKCTSNEWYGWWEEAEGQAKARCVVSALLLQW